MPQIKVYTSFSDLPAGIQNFFLRDIDDVFSGIIADNPTLEEGFFDGIDAPILDAVMGLLSLDESVSKIRTFLSKIAPENQQKAMLAIFRDVFWPLREVLGKNLSDIVVNEKLDTSGWPQKRILYKPISYTGAISEIVNRIGLYSAGPQVRERFRDALVGLAKGLKIPDQVRASLSQPEELGGFGFDQKMAEKAMAVINDIRSSVQIMEEMDYQDYLAKEMAVNTARDTEDGKAATRVQVSADGEDEQIKTIRSHMPPPPKAVTELEKAIEAVYARIPSKPQDEYLLNRLKNVISSRLRDVRNSSELLALLQRDSKVGGLGLDRVKADEMAKVIEAGYTEFKNSIENEEKTKLVLQLGEQKKKIEDRRLREAEEHTKWYEEKIKKRETAEVEKRQIAEAFKKGLETKTAVVHPLDLKNAALEKKDYGVLVEAPLPATPAAAKALVGPQMNPSGAPVAAPKPPTVKVSAVTAEIARTKPTTVDGVQPVAGTGVRLQGLGGELGGMTLSAFRRLGKTPAEATSKIIQKLDTLGQDKFEHRVNGIRQWQLSPLSKMYLELVGQSFRDGKPIAVVAEEKRARGEDVLTREEIEALISLNNALHF